MKAMAKLLDQSAMPVPLFSTSQTMENVVMSFKEEEEEVDHSGEVFEAREIGTGPLDKKYERVPPDHFTNGSDDLFMRSMIMAYAQEHKTKEGAPNGNFGMTEATTRAAASEVLATHKGLSGSALSTYLDTYFPRTWAHF